MTSPTTAPTTSGPATHAPPELTHPCARCGAPVPLNVGLCERCNPLGLKDSASSQVHGTVFLGIGLGFVFLALLARWAVAGIGPFSTEIVSVRSDNGSLVMSLQVTNKGSSAGPTTCRVTDPAIQGSGKPVFFLTPRIEPNATITLDQQLPGFGATVRPLSVDCSAP